MPRGLIQKEQAPREVQQFQCPDEPENVFKGDDKQPLPPGMVRPIRAVTRAAKPGENDILDTRMTLDINFVTQFAIVDIFDYIANFGSIEAVKKQLRDIGESTAAEDITKYTPAGYIENLPNVNQHLVESVSGRFENTGVHIISVRLISPDISHKVSSALAAIPEERARAQTTLIKADATMGQLAREGKGRAAANLVELTAEAEGNKNIQSALGVSGEAVLASRTAKSVGENADLILAGAEGGMKDVLAAVTGAQAVLARKPRTNGAAA